jgi:hypothetical protein
MALAEDLCEAAMKVCAWSRPNAFYGTAAGLAPGAGLIYDRMPHATFNNDTGRFEARRGPVLVLTHECDIDPANVRPFNEAFIIAPIITMRAIADNHQAVGKVEEAHQLVCACSANLVSRLLFLPPGPAFLQHGAFVYLNALTSAHVSQLRDGEVTAPCALSAYGLEVFDHKLKNHLFRPKAEQLPRV